MGMLQGAPVLVVGAGIMGAGIAQVAALAGHPVWLYDVRDGAAAAARARLAETFDGLVAKGRLDAAAAAAALARIEPAASLAAAAQARIVIEAIVEHLDAKRGLFRELEGIVAADAILATNTSSISITAIASGLAHTGRVVGMHFFNPVPLMKLVEVIRGLQTSPVAADAVFALARDWGKVPVHATSTPGFIVNRIARPYYAEALALLQERAATPPVLDACLRGAGFRMGPCELMDLIGLDTNLAVTQSVFEANFHDKRFVPSIVQREMVAGGLLGRKSGQGFYAYPPGPAAPQPPAFEAPAAVHAVTVHGEGPVAEWLDGAVGRALAAQGQRAARDRDTRWTGVQLDGARLVLTDGRPAHVLAAEAGTPDLAVFDRPLQLPPAPGAALAFAVRHGASAGWPAQAAAWLHALGVLPLQVADAPGLVVARTIAMLINEAADAVQQGVCTADGADAAMKLGVAYPAGPFEWHRDWGTAGVLGVLAALDAEYRGERYRASPWLRRGGG